GRGEHPGVYERFGRRLSLDAYTVHALAVRPDDDPADLRDQIAALAADAVGPVVLAGTPDNAEGDDEATDWDQELELRTTCPTHRGQLTEDAAFTRGSLFEPVPDRLGAFLRLGDEAYAAISGNTLVIHGKSD